MPAFLDRILKPHYLFRPRQAGRRLLRAVPGPPPESAVVSLPWGLPLRIDPREDVGRAIWCLGLYDLAVSETLWRLLGPGDLAVDAGANIGYMTSIMALRAGPQGRVLACEPHPELFRRLTDNVARFGRSRPVAPVELSSLALGARAGRAYLACGDGFGTNQGTARVTDVESGIPIEVTTLDDMLGARTAAMVKIDVEGAEPEVLAGASTALRDGRIRNIVYEAYAAQREGLCRFLAAMGFEVLALGWSLGGLILSAPRDAPHLPGFESPNFLATRDPDSVLARLRCRGWLTLSSPRTARRGF